MRKLSQTRKAELAWGEPRRPIAAAIVMAAAGAALLFALAITLGLGG